MSLVQSIVHATERSDLCFASYNDSFEHILQIQGLFHPPILNPVKNDILIDHSSNLFFLPQ